MQINIIYTIALASLFGLLLLWKLLSLVEISTRQLILSYLRKRFLYTLVYHRRAGTDDINVASTINIIVLVAANMTACIYGLPDRIELARRCGALFLLNATPLLLGGRTSFLIDRIMILKPNQQSLLHRWMGRVCVLQGLIHGGISAASSSPTTLLQKAVSIRTATGKKSLTDCNQLLSVVAVLGIASFLYIRRYMYEIFLKTHLLLAVAIVVILWFHIPLSSRFNVIVLGVASGMWLIQQVFWLTRLCYRNLGSGSSMVTSFKEYSSHDPSSEGMGITLKLKRPWKVRPGQYVYLTLPNISRHHGGFLQAHPYAIAWMEGSDISLIVQRQSGFSNDVFRATGRHTSVIVDGPYGQPQQFMCYDKVLFIASGIGVAAHLLAIRDLLEAHENRSARVRRITLLWFLETMG
jgi:predicted ferric reductase